MGADDEAGEEINQEDVWEVISAYFDEKGLVRQQLDSFDEFIMNTMQEIVDESPKLELVPNQQHNPTMQTAGAVSYGIQFGQIYLSKPTWVEADQTTSAMFPNEARLRNLTYAAPLYMDLTQTTRTEDPDDPDGAADEEKQQLDKVFLGQVPIMLRSTYCILKDSNDRELTDLGARRKHAGRCAGERRGSGARTEIVDGRGSAAVGEGLLPRLPRQASARTTRAGTSSSTAPRRSSSRLRRRREASLTHASPFPDPPQVLIAQEKMTNNAVYCFSKKQPSK